MSNISRHAVAKSRTIRITEQSPFDLLLMTLVRPHVFVQILFWRILGKRVRARGRLETAIAGLPFATERRMSRDGKSDLARLVKQGRGERQPIYVHLHVTKEDNRRQVNRALSALLNQSYRLFHVVVTLGEGASLDGISSPAVSVLLGRFSSRMDGLHSALREASDYDAEWLVPTLPAFTMARHAMAGFAAEVEAIREQKNVAVLYADQGERSPWWSPSQFWLKPQFDHRMFLSQDYVTAACALNVERTLSLWPTRDGNNVPNSLYELALVLVRKFVALHFVRVLVLTPPRHWQHVDEKQQIALSRSLGDRAKVGRGPFGTIEIRWDLPERLPTVSVIVATRDRVELLRTCVEGVLNATGYPALDLIIADNESVDPETLRYMDEVSTDPRVQVVRWPHPFNYSAINNFAATLAKGEFLCLLNNDIEIIDPDWLTEMVREACQPNVGAVGARLLYPDRSIQHAGVAIGIGNAAGHAHRGLAEGDPGYYAQALMARGASAVTGACLLVAKNRFDEVGGLDADKLAVAYNDVDLCLKLQDLGLQNIYTPLATLIHHESKSRGVDFAPEHLARYMRELETFQDRWDTRSVTDPWHHIFLDRSRETYSL